MQRVAINGSKFDANQQAHVRVRIPWAHCVCPNWQSCRLVSLGLAEGLNNKIRVLQRRACGYRDEAYLKLKIIAVFLPPLPRMTENDPH